MILTNVTRFFVKQNSRYFSHLSDKDISFFKSILGNSSDVIEDKDELVRYNIDWTKKFHGRSQLALRPQTTEQVSQILRYCNENHLAVVPHGGNTGLVGGAVPISDEIVLTLEKMNRILNYDTNNGVIVVEAGCILESADNYLRDQGHIMPLDLGAKGSCTIGGNLATNAGGLRLLRYGSLRGNVLGMTTVLADGTILNDTNLCKKNNTGYEWKQLMIGSEGTLGVITAANIMTPPWPQSVQVLVLTVKHFSTITEIFKKTKIHLAEILSAFEFWDQRSQELVVKHHPECGTIPSNGKFNILIETHGSNAEHDQQKLMNLLEELQNSNLIIDGTMAQDEKQLHTLWSCRENIPEAGSREGLVIKYDITLSNVDMYEPVILLKKRLNNLVQDVIGFGHFGDGNIHVNIICNEITETIQEKLEPLIYEFVRDHKGSISAEHGIGLAKAKYLSYAKSKEEIAIMKKLKMMFDPKGILNPNKVLC